MWTFGTTVFKGLTGFTGLSSSLEANYIEHGVMGEKPRLQRIGTNLETITAEIQLHSSFCVPEAELSKLYGALEDGTREPLLNGSGIVFGYYVIRSLELTYQQTDSRGAIVLCNLSVEFLEAYNPNDQVARKSGAFALSIPGRGFPGQMLAPKRIPTSDAGLAAIQVQAITTHTESMGFDIARAVAAPEQTDQQLGRVGNRLTTVESALYQLNQRITNTASNIYGVTGNMRSQLGVVAGAATVLRNAVDSVNLVASQNAHVLFKDSVQTLQRYASGLAYIKAIRL